MEVVTQPTNDSSIKLRIDNLISSKNFIKFSTLILFLLGAIFILALNSPSPFLKRSRAPANIFSSVYQNLGYEEKPFDLSQNPVLAFQVNELRSLNKFISLTLTPFKIDRHQKSTLTIQTEVSAFILHGSEIETEIFTKKREDITFDCLVSTEEICSEEQVINLAVDEVTDFYFVIKFLNAKEIAPQIANFQVESTTLSITYRVYMFAVQLFLLLATLGCWFLSSSQMRHLDKEFFTKEQKTFPFLMICLVVINQPFGAYLLGGMFYHWIMAVFFVWFSVSQVWYWMSIAHDLAGSESSLIESSSMFVKFYTLLYALVFLVANLNTATNISSEPTYEFQSEQSNFALLMEALLYLTLTIGVGWICFKIFKILKRKEDLVEQEREGVFFWFSAVFIFAHFYFVAKGYLCPASYNAAGTILFCGVSTIYVLTTNLIFLPTKEGVNQAQHIKKYDNPAVRDCYKDLEESKVHESGREMKSDSRKDTTPEHEAVEKKYPFENKDEEEL